MLLCTTTGITKSAINLFNSIGYEFRLCLVDFIFLSGIIESLLDKKNNPVPFNES